MKKILVVDDEKSLRHILSILLKKNGYHVTTASNCNEAIDLLDKEIFDLVITDIRMPDGSGMKVLEAVKEISNDTVVIMMTAYGTMENAVEAMRLGAYDYIIKPFKVEEIRLIINNALEKRSLKKENKLLKKELKQLSSHSLLGQSPAFIKTLDIIDRIAPTVSSILITGETGTGKELAARAIHYKSKRKDEPFVTINCGAIPENLLESELFGHIKGSFTGAQSNKEGLFEVADGGTIFLDEIGEMPFLTQVKLLRVLQEKEFRRIGDIKDIKVDTRIIAATNRNLAEEVADGRFREDLFYRLSVIPLHLPPLRERREDIPLLANHFLRKYAKIAGKVMTISDGAIQLLVNKKWPGNIRELENTLERIVAFNTKKMVTSKDIEECSFGVPAKEEQNNLSEVPPGGMDLEKIIGSIEQKLLISALEQSDWQKKKAANLLGLNFRSFRYRLEKYNIKKSDQ